MLASCNGGGNSQQANNQASDSLVAEVQEEELGDMEPEGCEPDDSFYLDLTVDTAKMELELFMDYPGDSGSETKKYNDIPFVFTDFEAEGFNREGKPVKLISNIALGYKVDWEVPDEYDEEMESENPLYPNGLIKRYFEEMPEIPDWFEIDIWSLKITKSIEITDVYDKVKRVSDNEYEYTCEWDNKVQYRKKIRIDKSDENLDYEMISAEYDEGTAFEESPSLYYYSGEISSMYIELCPMSKLARWVFAECPNYYESNKKKSKRSLGFADVFMESGYEFQCGAHGMGGFTTDNITKNGDTLKVFDVIKKELEEELVEKLFGIYGEEYQISEPDAMQLSCFYLTPDNVTLYWSHYEIAPYSSGNCEMELPYKEYEKYLTKDFKSLLKEAGKL